MLANDDDDDDDDDDDIDVKDEQLKGKCFLQYYSNFFRR